MCGAISHNLSHNLIGWRAERAERGGDVFSHSLHILKCPPGFFDAKHLLKPTSIFERSTHRDLECEPSTKIAVSRVDDWKDERTHTEQQLWAGCAVTEVCLPNPLFNEIASVRHLKLLNMSKTSAEWAKPFRKPFDRLLTVRARSLDVDEMIKVYKETQQPRFKSLIEVDDEPEMESFPSAKKRKISKE
jgi:hypothetical protein